MNDRRLENMIGHLLRAGVFLAAAVVLTGGAIYLAHHAFDRAEFHTFAPGGPDLRMASGIVQSAAHFRGEGLIQIGLLLLIATPVLRVMMALLGFALERDRLYSTVSLIVLLILAYSLMFMS
jgi:uncharacterized membrane protein